MNKETFALFTHLNESKRHSRRDAESSAPPPPGSVQESIQNFLKYRDPPAPEAPQSEWNAYFLYHLLGLKQGQDALREDLSKQVNDINARLAFHQQDDSITGRQIAKHHATLRHYGVVLNGLGRDIEALEDIVRPMGPCQEDDVPELPADSARASIISVFHDDAPKAAQA